MKMNYYKTFLLGLGFLGVSALWGIYNAFVPVILSEKFALGPLWVAFFLSLDNIGALLIQPPAGVWSDRLRTPWGRRLPFILVAAPISALAMALLPLASLLPLFALCTGTLVVSMAVWRTPVMTLVADITPSKFRSEASGIVSFMGGLGGIIAYFGGGALYNWHPQSPFFAGALVVALSCGILLIFIREPPIPTEYSAPTSGVGQDLLRQLTQTWQAADKSKLYLLCALILLMVGYTGVEGFFTLYALHHLGMGPGLSSVLLGQLSLVFILSAIPSGALARYLPRRVIVMVGLVLMAATLFGLYLLPPDRLTATWLQLPVLGPLSLLSLLLMVAGLSWALVIIHPLPMLADMTDPLHLGGSTGLYYLFMSLAAIVGPNLNGFLVQWSGQDYNTVMLVAPIWFLGACFLMGCVRSGEPQQGAPPS